MPEQETIREPARQVSVYGRCDVLVVGGGPAGSAAAASAARMGADTILVERYGHLGGAVLRLSPPAPGRVQGHYTTWERAGLEPRFRAHPMPRNDVALFMGPRLSGYSATDVDDLNEVELESGRRMMTPNRGCLTTRRRSQRHQHTA